MDEPEQPQKQPAAGTAPPGTSAAKRYALIGVPLLLVLLVASFLFWPRIKLSFTLNGLNSDNPATFRENRARLVDAPKDKWVDDLIIDAIRDSDRTFKVRLTCVGIMLDRSRHTHLEAAYRDGDLDTRSVILARWHQEPFFERTYAKDPAYGVADTLRAWLARKGDLTRTFALPVILRMDLKDTMPEIRSLLTRDTDPRGDRSKKRNLLIGAISAVNRFGDCESVPHLKRLAETDPDPIVRMRALQNLQLVAFQENSACAGELSEEDMQALVIKLFDDESHEVRMATLTNLQRAPARAKALEVQLQALLDSHVTGSKPRAARREALHVLLALKEPAFLNTLPIYFHDEDQHIRSSCAMRAGGVEAPRLDSCLIGLLQQEHASDVAFREALKALRQKAGRFKGYTQAFYRMAVAKESRREYMAGLGALFAGQEVEGTTRAGIVKAWFEWLADDLGVEEEKIPAAVAAREAFWEAADKGDVGGAQAALESLGGYPPELFNYEDAWIAINEN